MSVPIDKLRTVPLFAGLDDESLERIAHCANEFRADKGHVLIEYGQPGAGVFIVEEGSVRVDLPTGEKNELGEGAVFGELAVLANTPRTARVSVVDDFCGFAIRRDDLLRLLRAEPSIAIALLQDVAGRLAEKTHHH